MSRPEPSAAERSRSVLARADGAMVTWLDAGGSPDPRPRSLVIDDSRELGARASRSVAVEIADPAPLACRERVRARLRIRGHASPPSDGTLRLFPDEVQLQESDVCVEISPAELLSARPDLLATREGGFLTHLASDHAEVLRVLVRLVDRELLEGAQRAVPLAIDRHGLVMRVEYRRGHTDVRLPFDAPASTLEELRASLRALAQRAHEACPGSHGRRRRAYGLADLFRAGPAAARICRPEP